MSVRLGALLCLTGLAACSHDQPPRSADDPGYVTSASEATPEPAMKPASFEDSSGPAESPRPRQPAGADARDNPEASRSTSSSSSATTEPPKTSEPAPAVPPDNTKVNERDRSTTAPTPLDQGENETDLKITQQIRQAVMSDKSLSFTAKNVKIITLNGKVTLRGPVNTAQERSAIEAAARKVAGATQIDNQLEVKK